MPVSFLERDFCQFAEWRACVCWYSKAALRCFAVEEPEGLCYSRVVLQWCVHTPRAHSMTGMNIASLSHVCSHNHDCRLPLWLFSYFWPLVPRTNFGICAVFLQGLRWVRLWPLHGFVARAPISGSKRRNQEKKNGKGTPKSGKRLNWIYKSNLPKKIVSDTKKIFISKIWCSLLSCWIYINKITILIHLLGVFVFGAEALWIRCSCYGTACAFQFSPLFKSILTFVGVIQ